MTGTERMKALMNGEKADRVPISGWFHMPTVDRYPEKFIAETIRLTDWYDWDFIKVMPHGHYFDEAYGGKLKFLEDPLIWGAQILEYPIKTVDDLVQLPVLDPYENPVFAREVSVIKGIADHYKGTKPVLPTLFNSITWLQELSHSTVPDKVLDYLHNHNKEMHQALETILQTNIKLVDAYVEAGADGFFISSQFACRDLLTQEEFREVNTDYDLRLLEHINSKGTWFNLMHVHGDKNLYFEEFAKYPVQAINWENTPAGLTEEEITSVAKARSLFDGVLIGGIDQHHDFYGTREEVKAVLKKRLETALAEDPTGKFVFAPGCVLELDVDREMYTLFKEIVEQR